MQHYAAILLAVLTAAAFPTSMVPGATAENIQEGLTNFALLGSNGRYARLDTRNPRSNSLKFDGQALGNDPQGATLFDLGQDGALTVSVSSSFQFGGHRAMQATDAGTTAVIFEHPNSANSGYTIILCSVQRLTNIVKCTVGDHPASSGTISNSHEWHVGGESGPQFLVKAVLASDAKPGQAAEKLSQDVIPGDQAVLHA